MEIEVEGALIRKHGLLLKEKKPNSYEQLVQGFVDNVRLMVRTLSQQAFVNAAS